LCSTTAATAPPVNREKGIKRRTSNKRKKKEVKKGGRKRGKQKEEGEGYRKLVFYKG
jgi:hypothetical protein